MPSKLETCNRPKFGVASVNHPKEIGVLFCIRVNDLAFGRHHLG